MATEFLMPKLGLTMEEGTITEWFADDGASITAGAPLLRIETDKTETDVEAAATGRLHRVGQVEQTHAGHETLFRVFDLTEDSIDGVKGPLWIFHFVAAVVDDTAREQTAVLGVRELGKIVLGELCLFLRRLQLTPNLAELGPGFFSRICVIWLRARAGDAQQQDQRED